MTQSIDSDLIDLERASEMTFGAGMDIEYIVPTRAALSGQFLFDYSALANEPQEGASQALS